MEEDDLAKRYRAEAAASIAHESDVRLTEVINLEDDEHFSALSLVNLVKEGEASDLVAALMVRLGEVRVALIGHGGALLVDQVGVVIF